MAKKRDTIMRTDPEFRNLVKEIKFAKLSNKTAKEILPDRRITKMFTRVPGVKEFIIKSKLIDEK